MAFSSGTLALVIPSRPFAILDADQRRGGEDTQQAAAVSTGPMESAAKTPGIAGADQHERPASQSCTLRRGTLPVDRNDTRDLETDGLIKELAHGPRIPAHPSSCRARRQRSRLTTHGSLERMQFRSQRPPEQAPGPGTCLTGDSHSTSRAACGVVLLSHVCSPMYVGRVIPRRPPTPDRRPTFGLRTT